MFKVGDRVIGIKNAEVYGKGIVINCPRTILLNISPTDRQVLVKFDKHVVLGPLRVHIANLKLDVIDYIKNVKNSTYK